MTAKGGNQETIQRGEDYPMAADNPQNFDDRRKKSEDRRKGGTDRRQKPDERRKESKPRRENPPDRRKS
jgi:hypothetical protein